MKKYLLTLLLFFVATPALATNTSGYAWSESLGWFDFGSATVSDTAITGYAYNDNTGWLVLDGVTNSGGTLTGYAWSESVGYFDFSNAYIESGSIKGYAYNDNTGWLSFEDDTNVTTTWAPATPPTNTPRSSGSSVSSRIRNLLAQGKNQEAEQLKQQFPNTPAQIPTTPNNQSQQGRNLQLGDQGDDVKGLQIVLNLLNYQIASQGPGSPGNETTLFGQLTRQALIKFQQDNNITPAVGYFGPITRQALITKLISLLLTNN